MGISSCPCTFSCRSNLPLYLVLLLITWLYCSYTLFALPRLLFLHGFLPIIPFQTSFLLLVLSLFRCLHDVRSKVHVNMEIKDMSFLEKKGNGEKRKCMKCHVLKPDRTHHCKSCGCILKMDHHCVFLNK